MQALRGVPVIWLKRLAWATGGLLLLWLLAWLGVPPLLKWQAQTRLTAALGRNVSVGDVAFQPWRLEFSLTDLVVAAPPGATPAEPLLQVARLRADLAFWPLFKGLPVIQSLDIDAPRLRMTRTAPERYDVDDLIERFSRQPDQPPSSEPTQFALYNLQVRNAQLRFDDRPAGRVHQVESLQLALPFLSNQPAKVAITVEPHLAFKLNGTAFDSGARATPFAPTRDAELKLAMSDLDVGPYLSYLPQSLPVRLTRGTLSAELSLAFTRPVDGTPRMSLRGWVGARNLALDSVAGTPLLSWRQLRLGLRDVQPLQRRLAFDELRIEGAQLQVTRDAGGHINLLQLATAPAGAAAPPPATPWQISLAAIDLADARLLWNDATTQPAAALQLDDLALTVKSVQWPMTDILPVTLTATLRGQADKAASATRLTLQGSANHREARLSLGLTDLSLATLAPYLAQQLVPRLEGRLSAQGTLDWSAATDAPRLQFSIDSATLSALRLHPGSVKRAGVDRDSADPQQGSALEALRMGDLKLDLPARSATLGSLTLVKPSLWLARDAQGRLNVADWLRDPIPTTGATSAQGPKSQAPEAPEAPWRLQLRNLHVEGGRLQLTDAAARPGHASRPVRADFDQVQIVLQDFGWSGERAMPAATLQLSARVGGARAARDKTAATGQISWKGQAGLWPLQARGSLRIVRFPVQVFAAYFADQVPVSLLRAEAGYTGSVALRAQRTGLDITAAGDVLLADVHVAARRGAGDLSTLATGADELLSWQAFALQRVKFVMKPGTRPQLEVGEAALTDFFARLVVTEDGRFNLRDIAAPEPPAEGAAASAPASAAVATAVAAALPASTGSTSTSTAQHDLPLDISVGTTRLNNGHIDFSDHFVRPNYSADLTELNGELGPFRSASPEMATLTLRGRAAGTALLDISGRINPTVQPLALDIKARATDLELAPLSTYAGKYAGYAIERGKLSLEVAYRIDPDGKLQASNQLILNQLTFGERIESPSATKLPVLLAVALLKDRHGVIDINLPISGSVNDPEFSVGRIIVRLIFNLIAKALTAPFALLMGGGGGPDLSYVEFRPGTAQLAEPSVGTLDKVAKALIDRPALKMTVTGSADLPAERDAFRAAAIDTRLTAERRREGLRAGVAASAPVVVTAQDRTRLLKALYKQTDLPDKPRNALGFAKDLPDAEMEALLRQHVPVTDDVIRELALQRGIAVRDALMARGLGSERLFLAAPRLHEPVPGEAAWTPQVQLSLSVK